MPSPFPGMDPYLESRALWPGVHNKLIAIQHDALNAILAPRYWVDIEERLYIETEEAPGVTIVPDVALIRQETTREGSGASAALAPGFLEVAEEGEFPVRETYLVIYAMPERKAVTMVELLSPSNKANGVGRRKYLAKRARVLSTRTSLVEIDLLREGARPRSLQALPPHDYAILVHRGWEHPKAWARGWRLPEPLPEVPIPLLPSEPAARLDLAQSLRTLYDRGRYEVVIDYTKPPIPPLSPADGEWARRLLK